MNDEDDDDEGSKDNNDEARDVDQDDEGLPEAVEALITTKLVRSC